MSLTRVMFSTVKIIKKNYGVNNSSHKFDTDVNFFASQLSKKNIIKHFS